VSDGREVRSPAPAAAPADLERSIARLLTLGTYTSVLLLVVGVALMLATGVGPRSGGPRFDPARLMSDLASLRPAGFLWLGLVAVVATPAARVLASLIGYARRREGTMAIVAALILGVIALSVGLSVVLPSELGG
jgi:uncharacterized membrane protein